MIMLTREEREKFAVWLEQDAAGTEGLLGEMAKLPGTEMLAKLKRTEAIAQRIVAKMLRATEDMTL